MRTGRLELHARARTACRLNYWSFDPDMGSVPGVAAGAPRQARYRCTQHSQIYTQSSVQPDEPGEKVTDREDWLRAFAKARGLASSTTRFAEHGLAQCLIPWLC